MLDPRAQSTRGSERNQPRSKAEGRSRVLISTENVCTLFFFLFLSNQCNDLGVERKINRFILLSE